MNVQLVTHTENPDKICAMAAYVSVASKPLSEFAKVWTEGDTKKWLEIAIGKGHTSVLEHACFTFSLEGVSRALTHQLVRHRIASFTQQSLRRVKPSVESFKLPSTMRSSFRRAEVKSIVKKIHESYQLLIEDGVPAEDARFVLPIGTTTNILVTMNCRELLEVFFPLRCCIKAQWEIREVAWDMLSLCKRRAPVIFKNAGPRCYRLGYCPEGEPCELFKRGD